MIRFIASDLDGTLLMKDGSLPKETFDCIHALKEKGIVFCAASGRQYANLRRLFAPVADDMCFICENGSYVKAINKEISHPIPAEIAVPVIQDIAAAGMQVLMSTPECCLMFDSAERIFTNDIFYRLKNNCAIIIDHSLYADKLIKISGFTPDGVANLAPALQNKWKNFLHVDIAGKNWLDFTCTNKSDGIRALSEMLHIPSADMAAFGDQFNDLAMLQSVGHPFLMENAPCELKQYPFTLCSNVLETIKSFL